MIDWSITAGDARAVLAGWPAGAVQCVCYSPGYNLGNSPSARRHPHARRGTALDWRGYGPDADALPEPAYQAGQVALLDALYRVCRDGASVFYVHTPRFNGGHLIHPLQWLAAGPFAVRQEIIWDQGRTHQWDGAYWPPVTERIYWLTKGTPARLSREARRWTDLWRIPAARCSWHPAPFPRELARRCILAATQPGDTVLDPCCGTGTTVLVAHELGRAGVGIDANESYCEMARARIVGDSPLFNRQEGAA
jgi:DNA modification methylase